MPAVRSIARRIARVCIKFVAMLCMATLIPSLGRAQTIFSAVGSSATVTTSLDAFRTALGPLNTARREINWDGVPDNLASPNDLPADFFVSRGVNYSTPGTGFQVSSTDPTTSQFRNLVPSAPTFLEPFSGQRLFTMIGSNIMDVNFVVPGTNTPAFTSAFGVVFSDVDIANTTSMQFFDVLGNNLGTYFAPAVFGSETFSFLGVQFTNGEQIGRVRLTVGEAALSDGNLDKDLAAMDDFVFASPQQVVPEPSTMLLMTGGLAGLGVLLRRRKRAQ